MIPKMFLINLYPNRIDWKTDRMIGEYSEKSIKIWFRANSVSILNGKFFNLNGTTPSPDDDLIIYDFLLVNSISNLLNILTELPSTYPLLIDWPINIQELISEANPSNQSEISDMFIKTLVPIDKILIDFDRLRIYIIHQRKQIIKDLKKVLFVIKDLEF